MIDQLDFQLGKIIKVNSDSEAKTVDIRDFRTGGTVYRGVSLEPPAGDQFLPVVGQHVLFFTFAPGYGQYIRKIVHIYGSNDADEDLVLSSPIALEPGERKFVSQSGAMVYVGNGGNLISSGGQNIGQYDDEQLTQIIANKLQIVTKGGFLIQEKEGTLTISKGDLERTTTEYEVQKPKITITITGDKLEISGEDTTVDVNCKQVNLNGDSEPLVRGNRMIERFNNHVHIGNMGAPTSTVLTTGTQMLPTDVSDKNNQG